MWIILRIIALFNTYVNHYYFRWVHEGWFVAPCRARGQSTVLEAAKRGGRSVAPASFTVALARSSLCCSGAACEGVVHALISSHLLELGVLSKFLLTPAMVSLSRLGDHRPQANQSVTHFYGWSVKVFQVA